MSDLSWLLSAEAVRERCERIYRAGEGGALRHFELDLAQLDGLVDLVIDTTRANYPDLDIPHHSRWRHFDAGGIYRWSDLLHQHGEWSRDVIARISTDLVVTSVLLDAGAGAAWRYAEPETGEVYQRSEGLAVASFRAFSAGLFSSDPAMPHQADADGLARLSQDTLGDAFQVTETNPLIGVAGRVALLNRLADTLRSQPDRFGSDPPRIGNLFDSLVQRATHSQLPAAMILEELLDAFAWNWPIGTVVNGQRLGDVWHHSAIVTDDATNGLIPFHKLSQWLVYSLVEPLAQAGVQVTGLDALTGLPEYRNGGLFIDMGVLNPRREQLTREPQSVDSEAVVEWRALTVALLDRTATRVRDRLGLTAQQLPLAMLLEGGTWSAGRRIALALRPDGRPPIRLQSDGTVF